MQRFERSLRRLVVLVWLVPTVMAIVGAWRGRHATGRKVGKPFGVSSPWLAHCQQGPGWLPRITGLVRTRRHVRQDS